MDQPEEEEGEHACRRDADAGRDGVGNGRVAVEDAAQHDGYEAGARVH